jgi:hypothetical protein
MSARFTRDFSHVRAHSDLQGERSAHAVGARAFAVGLHFAFATGAYRPGTSDGDRLIAHELAHVVQQSKASIPATFGAHPGGSLYDAAESEADAAAHATGQVGIGSTLAAQRIQRQPAGDVQHPENFSTYEEWLRSFGSLPTFPARDPTSTSSPFDASAPIPDTHPGMTTRPHTTPVSSTGAEPNPLLLSGQGPPTIHRAVDRCLGDHPSF